MTMTEVPVDPSRRQYRLLDVARGLAALGVVLFHLGVPDGAPRAIAEIIRAGGLGPYIFFIISGYVIFQALERLSPRGSKGALIFLWRRARRIYPAFLASVVLALPVAALYYHAHLTPAGLLAVSTLTYPWFAAHTPQSV